MKKKLIPWLVLFALLAALVPINPVRAANAVVGSGTADSCTEAAFNSALTTVQSTGGGIITFNCGIAQKTITFTVQKVINLANITINGSNLITLNGSLGARHFFVGNGVTLTLQNITLRMGDPLASGGAIEINESKVVLETVQISNNFASTIGGALYCFGGTSQVTITNSLLENNSAGASGGAIYNDGCKITINSSSLIGNSVSGSGGAIFNAQIGNLTVNDSLFQNNEALDGAGIYNEANGIATLNRVEFLLNHGGYGGGVENGGTITINDSLFDTNTVTGSGGGFWNLFGTATINQTTFNNNSATEGGGVNSYGNHIEINQANITNNTASGSGGGIYHGGGTAFFSNLTINGNQADLGGGIYQYSNDNLTLTNATVVNNIAVSYGGGLYHYNRYALLTNVTLANNTAGVAGNAIQEDSPKSIGEPGVVQIVNSVILGNVNNCGGGLFTSLGYNLSQGTCASLSEPTDQEDFSGALNLSTLAANGGSYTMLTMKPEIGSPLIDAGTNTSCPATDQRGVTRPQGPSCDIGSIEYTNYGPTSLVNSVLPTSRTPMVGNTVTIFNTVLNSGSETASAVTLSMNPAPAGTFAYNQTDCNTNAIIGAPNAAVDIAPGGVACYVLSFTPSAAFSATQVHIQALASNASATSLLPGINTWLLRSTASQGPDIIALTTTTDFHQVACSGANAFAVALSNVGTAALGDITVSANTASASLPISISIQETDPGTGSIIGDHILNNLGAGENRTVAVFVSFHGCVAFDPAAHRIFVVFRDASNNVVGSTSTAISTNR